MYYYGNGVKKNYTKAKDYYEKADGQNNHFAPVNLARLYYYGHGVQKDHQKVEEYHQKVIEQGDKDAKMAFDKLLSEKNIILLDL